ncbi:aldehyde dehydrogenase, partial [Candidatus Woesearchaeota archaeon]|nr:aldehyde dehydrogenase [Candidatus Woesearchaeota archaeon]
MNVAINGFGRIGRTILRIALDQGVNVVAVNDMHGAAEAAYLLKYDTTYGRCKHDIKFQNDSLIVDGRSIKMLSEKEPNKLPWNSLGVDVVIESTGIFTDRDGAAKHLEAGAKKVLISAPAKKPDFTILMGVNHEQLKPEHNIISVASCTTNCLAPVMKVLHDNFKIKKALMTTIHAYTNDQVVQDGFHRDPRRGRTCGMNMIPTTTGASKAVEEVLPELKGKLYGMAVRVPVACGSLVDLSVQVEKQATVQDINAAVKKASETSMK